MKRIVVCMLLVGWAVAIAQAPPDEKQAAGADAGEQDPPCVPIAKTDSPDGEQEEAVADSVPCEERDPEATPDEEQPSAETPGEIAAGPEPGGEHESDVEASAEEEFNPGDEISEDYPVPLPSDI